MGRSLSGKDESKYPYIVELLVADDELDVELNRRIMNFHRSRKLKARHGRQRIVREEDPIYFRWCFSDLATAHEFTEEFGGAVQQAVQPRKRRRAIKRQRIAVNVGEAAGDSEGAAIQEGTQG